MYALEKKMNDNLTGQIANMNEVNSNCEEEKRLLFKYGNKDKLRKVIVGILAGFVVGFTASKF
jgi:hypothetical protein